MRGLLYFICSFDHQTLLWMGQAISFDWMQTGKSRNLGQNSWNVCFVIFSSVQEEKKWKKTNGKKKYWAWRIEGDKWSTEGLERTEGVHGRVEGEKRRREEGRGRKGGGEEVERGRTKSWRKRKKEAEKVTDNYIVQGMKFMFVTYSRSDIQFASWTPNKRSMF